MRRLNPEEIARIRALHQEGVTVKEIADRFQKHPDTIRRIIKWQSHKRPRV